MAIYKFHAARLAGYYFDSDKQAVFSTKRKGAPYQMTWSCNYRYPDNKFVSLTDQHGWKATVNQREIYAYLNRFAEPEVNKFVQQIQKDSIVSNGYIIGSVVGANYSFSTTPKIHATLSLAKAEAERLAKGNTTKRFVVVKIEGTVQATGVAWS